MTTRPGWKTTEFWAVVAIAVGSVASAAVGHLPDTYAAVASAVAVGAYAVGRGLAKAPSWSTVLDTLSRFIASHAPPASADTGPAAAELLATRERLTVELDAVQAQLAARGGTAKAEV